MKRVLFCFIVLLSEMAAAQQKEIQLYNGLPPGSENWTWKEDMNNNNSLKVMTVYNVIHPTLTVFFPEPGFANGAAVIIAPGGGFHFLAIDHEGNNAAKELIKKGIIVFVLKYRTFHITTDNPFDDMLNAKDPKAWDKEADPVIPLAIADGRKAIEYVRSHVAEYKINPNRIGFMGFSAGGMVAAATAFNYSMVSRPDFVAAIYGDIPEAIQSDVLPDAPPLFLACTQDDEFGFAAHAIRLYNKWYQAKRPAEMHLFVKGGHGFGIGNKSNTTYNWIEKFTDWLTVEGF
jgi:acetyl esterase/lipase